ncbi:retinoic acid receptor responder protein 2 [Phodopus roborovskii]|uniref:Retinoic acid receptor responder protein 2 n=1 Tax=Phodopus roborovskii TaxID=109678 RepID=A0AAV0A455_PHORO|nr:retinoic acid receptor responder protein 2 [Phodopus roborovskii]XP_051059050.1 retinoic acid receptor responder protein 2 [Phodopus roborovskii]CAH7160193.1 Rarres2 [Phodopus roborovskii]
MKCLLISLALWLGMVGIHGTELKLSEAQRRGLQVALEEFHKHPPVQWAFQEIGVDSADDMPFSAGTFVRLEFKLQQTSCLKKDWKKPECKIKPNGRKRKCLACIKLDPKGKVLGRMVHCPILKQGPQEDPQESQCNKIAQAGEDSRSYFFPGQFAFSRALEQK